MSSTNNHWLKLLPGARIKLPWKTRLSIAFQRNGQRSFTRRTVCNLTSNMRKLVKCSSPRSIRSRWFLSKFSFKTKRIIQSNQVCWTCKMKRQIKMLLRAKLENLRMPSPVSTTVNQNETSTNIRLIGLKWHTCFRTEWYLTKLLK